MSPTQATAKTRQETGRANQRKPGKIKPGKIKSGASTTTAVGKKMK
jgi:hypothetical protein